jgi:hypothetical protein
MDALLIREALQAVGDLLSEQGAQEGIVVVGGAAMTLRGFSSRTTADVDVIARVDKLSANTKTLTREEPLPAPVSRAAAQVAQDFNLPNDWLNAVIAHQWDQGLPPSIENDVEWRTFSNLHVGFAGRETLISLKLFAAVDQDMRNVHVQDLIQLEPTPEEWLQAKRWVRTQDENPNMADWAQTVIDYVNKRVD